MAHGRYTRVSLATTSTAVADRLSKPVTHGPLAAFAALVAFVALASSPCRLRAAENLVFVTWDGFRWQEMFTGAEERLISKDFGGVSDAAALRKAYWRDTPEARREVLLPFVWGVLAKDGQLFGDPTRKAAARLTNGRKFSYPGYNEMFAGFADSGIDSNNKIPNPSLMLIKHFTFLNIFLKPGYSFLMSEVKLSVCLLSLFNSIKRLELLLSKRVDHFINNFADSSFKIKPVYANLWSNFSPLRS